MLVQAKETQRNALGASRDAPCWGVVRRRLVCRVIVGDAAVLDFHVFEDIVRFIGQIAIVVQRPAQ